MRVMNILSLFDWISCWQVALRRLWIPIDAYYASEIDKFAIAVTQHRHPNTIQLGDIRERKTRDIDWGGIDLLFAGFSCQSRSIAGKWLWDRDPRWQLMWDMIDIRDHLLEHNPQAKFLFENVKMKKDFQVYVNEAIACHPVLINSALVSAQNRNRLYWTNINDWFVPQPQDQWVVLRDILEDEVDEKYYLSEEYHKRFEKSNLKMDWAIKVVGTTVWTGKWTNSRHRVHTDEWKIWTISATDHKQPKQIIRLWQIRKLTPRECERLQTLPDDYTLVPRQKRMMSDTQRYKQCGNWWTVDVICHILSFTP